MTEWTKNFFLDKRKKEKEKIMWEMNRNNDSLNRHIKPFCAI